jgi:hypothetical protein
VSNANNIIREALAGATKGALDRTVGSAIDTNEKREIVDRVLTEAAPVVLNQTNQEPWYQSRVTLSALLAILSGLLATLGYADILPNELRGQLIELFIAAGPVIAGVGALYGRWVAKKPLGS